jgi:hypothetical protein
VGAESGREFVVVIATLVDSDLILMGQQLFQVQLAA